MAITVWSILLSNLLPIVSGSVAAPSFFEKDAVLTAASQQHGTRPRRLHMPANHMPENPTE